MSDTKETPTARSTIFANIHDDACELFHNGRYEESEQLCLTLLAEPDLGDYHKARCYYILGMSSEHDYLWHAQQAVELIKNLYVVRPCGSYQGEAVSREELDSQAEWLKDAREALEVAELDQAEVLADYEAQLHAFRKSYNRDPTQSETVRAHMERRCQKSLQTLDDNVLAARFTRQTDLDDDEGEESEEEPMYVTSHVGSSKAVKDLGLMDGFVAHSPFSSDHSKRARQ